MDNEADEQLGFELGAVDYISKPISGPILRARVKLHLSIKQRADLIKHNNTFWRTKLQSGHVKLNWSRT